MTIEQLKDIVNSGVDEASKMTDLSSGKNKTQWRLILGERLWFKTLLNAVDYKLDLTTDYKVSMHYCSLRGWVYCSGNCSGCEAIIGKDVMK